MTKRDSKAGKVQVDFSASGGKKGVWVKAEECQLTQAPKPGAESADSEQAESAADADMGLVYGIGFPPFRGGALRYIDTIGVAEFVAITDKYAEFGAMYAPTEKLREMAKNGQKFFG